MQAAGTAQPIALGQGEGEALFRGGLAIIKAGGKATEGRCAVIENLAAKGLPDPARLARVAASRI